MIRRFFLISGSLSSIVVAVVLFIFGESLLVGSILLLGPLVTFALFALTFSLLSCLVITIIKKQYDNQNKFLLLINKWIKKKEKNIDDKKQKYLRYGKIFGILIFSITAGPLPASIFIAILVNKINYAYFFSILTNITFFIIWILIYSGGMTLVINLFN
jgi:hypothetical protein